MRLPRNDPRRRPAQRNRRAHRLRHAHGAAGVPRADGVVDEWRDEMIAAPNDDRRAQIVQALVHYNRLRTALHHASPAYSISGWQEMFLNALSDLALKVEDAIERESKIENQ